ncbi:MAG: ABC transporter permease [Paraclostridium sp.]|uniref:ABC transporter permease n=1 Tax=Paraclostridium sp. TaxID=2023273 RepID=UPI003F380528
MKKYTLKNNIEIFMSYIVFLIIWEVVALKIDNDIYLPTIGKVLMILCEIIKTKSFYLNVSLTIVRSCISFIIACCGAVLIGSLSYLNSTFKNMIIPLNNIFQSIPTMILVVLILIWFDKEQAPFIIGISIVLPILYEAVLGALNNIDKNIIEMVYIYDIKLIEKIKKIYIPSIKMSLVPILISTFSLVFKVVIAGEIYGQPAYGIGTIIQVEKINFNTAAIFAWIIVIGMISILLNYMQKHIVKINYKWRKK